MKVEDMVSTVGDVVDAISEVYIGNREVIVETLAAALVNGNVLFEDHPGLGKTLLAKAFAKVLGLDYKRVQFTPDLLPADILGTKVWRQNLGTFELVKGPIFTNVLLADEINRAPPKTQSALLEA
ncbi:AAA family ATPase, partial [Thermococcus sp.]|uniref:AAA family ATPase n=1 Tax=Thermococcus sp. TaxID=35749 RepID=UPI002627B66F